jgi:PGF-CTERM protein
LDGRDSEVVATDKAEGMAERTWVIRSGPVAEGFRIIETETRGTIVNGPTVDALADIRPSIEFQPIETPTRTASASPTETTAEPVASPTRTVPTTSSPGQPGFGGLAALAALASLALWRYRRR